MRCAVIQMNSGQDVDQNLEQAQELILNAQAQQAELILLPEMFACLGVNNQFELAKNRFIKADVIGSFSKWAVQAGCYLIAGSVPLVALESDQSEKVYAACLVFSPAGDLIAQYNKIHLFDVDVADTKGRYQESDTFLAGDKPQVVDIDGHKVGLSICYDLRFPELYQEYQLSGCEILTVPSAFTYETGRQHWEILLRARAIETQCFVLAANQAGEHEDGRRTWGQSLIIAPNGEVLAQGDNESQQVIVADLDFNVLEQCRKRMPIAQHKTPSV